MIQRIVTVGKKGQITIPKVIRDALKIQEGSTILFSLQGDKIILTKVS